jgi:hypothetical protein
VRRLRVVPPAVNLIAKGVKGRIETGGFEACAKDMPYTACADLIDVLAPRTARIFSDLEIASAYALKQMNWHLQCRQIPQ